MTRHIYITLFLLFLANIAPAQPKHEVRAVWLTTIGGIDWPHSYAQTARSIEKQKDELRLILDKLQRANINTILLQTRIRGTVIYPSAYEPWDGCLSGHPGKSPGYDALKFAVDECHKRGMELHAWIVTMPVGKWDALGCRQLRKRMPHNIRKIGSDGYMNPENKQTGDYLADICAEVARNYDIDGIHLDYIRYPETWTLKVSRDKGREYITNIVKKISRRVKHIKPWVKMSCSPVGKHDDLSRYRSHGWNAYTTVCQDAQGWLRDGLMDELFPMMYFRDNNFYPFAIDWKEQSHGRIVVPGLGIYFMSPKEKNWPLIDITRELEVLRANGMGHAYFRSKFFTDDTKGIYTFALKQFCTAPSLIPPMTWMSRRRPAQPDNFLRKTIEGRATLLSWTHEEKDTTMVLFNVYSSKEYPVNTNDAQNLIATRRQGRSLIVPIDASRHYAVTATDRYGNESIALQEDCDYGSSASESPLAVARLLACDGHSLALPESAKQADAAFLIVETLQGEAVATMPMTQNKYADDTPQMLTVTGIADGFYSLRTLGKKGVSHRLGFFIIRR